VRPAHECMQVPTTARALPHRYGCAGERARADGSISHPPFPFTCGSIMLASTQLIVRRRVNSNGVSDDASNGLSDDVSNGVSGRPLMAP